MAKCESALERCPSVIGAASLTVDLRSTVASVVVTPDSARLSAIDATLHSKRTCSASGDRLDHPDHAFLGEAHADHEAGLPVEVGIERGKPERADGGQHSSKEAVSLGGQ